MKKLLLSLLLVLPFCSFAQKGMQGVGMTAGYGTPLFFEYETYSTYNIGAIYQNNITDNFRLSTSLEMITTRYYDYYDGYDENARYFLLGVDAHYFLCNVSRLRPYAVAGFAVGTVDKKEYDEYGYYHNRYQYFTGGAKLGVGLNYRLGYHLTTQLEIPIYVTWLYHSKYYCLPSLSVLYTF